jgi:hypothetical protein
LPSVVFFFFVSLIELVSAAPRKPNLQHLGI